MEIQQIERQLHALERNSVWMRGLSVALIVAIGLALVSLRLGHGLSSLIAPETRYTLVVGLCGIVLLFSLYMLLKQHQIQSLRSQLFDAALREESLRTRLTGLSGLFESIAHVGGPIDVEPVLQTLAENIRGVLEVDHVSLMLLDSPGGTLVCRAACGEGSAAALGAQARWGDDVAGWVAAHNEALALDADELAHRFSFAGPPYAGMTAGLCVPLTTPDHVIGVVNIVNHETARRFGLEDMHLVGVFAAHIAMAIRRIFDQQAAAAARALRDDRARQSQKMEALGRLAGGIAHDFNNLLTVVLASGKALRRPADPERANAHLDRITDAAERCAQLTRQLLAFSRRQVIETRVFDLNEVLASMSGLVQQLTGESIEVIVTPALQSTWVRADEQQMEQVILNLAMHAREAMPGSGRLVIETANVDLGDAEAAAAGGRTGEFVLLRVTDTGNGMDEETSERVFEPFFSETHLREGSLGLATTYGVVSQAGGFIAVHSRPAQGTTFRIYLPRVEAPAFATPEPRAPMPAPFRPATVLVVEDEDNVRRLVVEMLEAAGYHVLSASWAGEAALVAEEHPESIDLLVTDVVMPGESGGQLARWMTQSRPSMPVLYMSGYPDDALVYHGISRDGCAFLQKPFTEEELLEKVRSTLHVVPQLTGLSAEREAA